MKKTIETMLPLSKVNELTVSEKVRKGHPGKLHPWWNRGPIDSSIEILKALITADNNASSDSSERLGSNFIISDPFSGFGGFALASQRLGLQCKASDLNSVAVLLSKAVTEIPARFTGNHPVSPKAESKLYFKTEGLAEDVLCYGEDLKGKAQEKLSTAYPDEESNAFAWVWVRTIKCPNPACGCDIPAGTSFILSKTKGHEYWAEPVVDGKKVYFRVHQGICPEEKETNRFGKAGAKFRCPVCGQITREAEVKKEGKLGLQLMAVCLSTKEGKIFVEPDEVQIKAADTVAVDGVPIGSLPKNSRWFSPRLYGMTEYTDLYTPRQMLLMTTLCDLVDAEIAEATNDALQAGMADDGIPLQDGGTGALAYGQAVGVYLSLAISGHADFQSSLCSWDNRHGNIRAAFMMQALPMTWVFGETNPFASATGNISSQIRNAAEVLSHMDPVAGTEVTQENAMTASYPDHAVMFTELPYYDNVGYADLSDYFYILLRRCLKNVYPMLFDKVVTSKEELCSIPEHYGGDQAKAIAGYRKGLEELFRNFYRQCNSDDPSLVFFLFGEEDKAKIAMDHEESMSAFEHLIFSITQARFAVTAIWPLRAELLENAKTPVRVAVVFRRQYGKEGTTKRGLINSLKREMPAEMDKLTAAGIAKEDLMIAGLGKGMQIFSKYSQVINADGSKPEIHDVLQLIHHEVMEYISLHETEQVREDSNEEC